MKAEESNREDRHEEEPLDHELEDYELEEENEDEGQEFDDEYTGPGEKQVDKPSKNEIKVAKWMKKNVKTKKTKFLSHNVEYFTSSKAIDALMKSKFASSDSPLFTTRDQAIEFLDVMLEHKFFHRAKKVPVSIEELRVTSSSKSSSKSKDDKKDDKSSSKNRDKDKDKDKDSKEDNKKETEAEAEEQSGANGGDDAAGTNGSSNGNGAGGDKKDQKRKRKIRLDMHPEQLFVDGSEAYVWIYDPIPLHYWIYGLILLLGAIGICLFPLWPPTMRQGVYYLSVAAAGFLVFILALTVLRLIIFSIVWAITGGRLHFWIFPNLTEDVGFFASFWPLYESNYSVDEEKSKSEKKSKSKSQKKKEKDSDAEEEAAPEEEEEEDVAPLEPEKIEEIKEHDADALLRLRHTKSEQVGASSPSSKSDDDSNSSEAAAESDAKGSASPSESESEISGRDYEIISSSEVQNVN